MRRAFLLLLALTTGATGARGQASPQECLAIRANRRDPITARSTVTAAFTVINGRQDSVIVTPIVELPKDWTLLMGGAPMTLPARSTEMLMLSAVVPARAIAGVYSIRVRITSPRDSMEVVDSVLVVVPARRALDLAIVDRPAFIISGRTYDAGFLLRNRGNQSSLVKLDAHSSLGDVVTSDSVVRLEPDESRVVRARVRTRAGLEAATDDVLEIAATMRGDTVRGDASARVTVVPEPSRKIEEYLKVPTRVHLRAASTEGVSPFEVFGQGIVRDGTDTRVDFLLRGPTGPFSAFGERDEYRVDLTAPDWRLRLGDQFFMLTPLTGGAQPGIGGGADGNVWRGALSLGGYGQQFRHSPAKGSEIGAFVAARPLDGGRVALNLVDRRGGGTPASVGSATASYGRGAYRAEGEMARSSAPGGRTGGAQSARLSGAGSGYSIDIGHHYADTSFAGALRGSAHDYLTASAQPFGAVSFALNGGSHRTDLSPSTRISYKERLDVGVLAATFVDRVTLELSGAAKSTIVQGLKAEGEQLAVRGRADQPTRVGQLSLEAETGTSRDPGAGAVSHVFTQVSLGVRHTLPGGTLGLWVEQYSGGAIMQGAEGTRTLGGDATLALNRTTNVSLTGFVTRQRVPGGDWHSQVDALVSRAMRNGSTISLRARLIGGGSYRSADQSVAFLEYGMPLRLPVSRLRTTGRVYGRVVDAATGAGVPGALVRLGPQVAITDGHGEVAFGGVPGGEHRLSMSQETSFADAVFVGDPTLRVDSTQTQPTTFRLAIARSARVDIDVRRFTIARTGIAGAADSVSDAGPLADAMLMLVSDRDTLYRTTNASGTISFTDVPPGNWVLSIRGEAPAFHRFDPDRVEVQLAPGETRALTFRLLPRRREVQILGDGQELRPTAADPKTSVPASSTRTVKPNRKEKRDDKREDKREDRQF